MKDQIFQVVKNERHNNNKRKQRNKTQHGKYSAQKPVHNILFESAFADRCESTKQDRVCLKSWGNNNKTMQIVLRPFQGCCDRKVNSRLQENESIPSCPHAGCGTMFQKEEKN